MPPLPPLHGVRVLSLATNLPGPLAAARLTAFGATVTKIEPPAGDGLQAAAAAWYAELTAGQVVQRLDLKTAGGMAAVASELAQSALLLTSMRPSALRKLGLAEMLQRNPGLSHVEIVGHDGADAETPGHDLTYQAAHGTLLPPALPLVPVVDMLGAERAVSAALIALRVAAQTGVGHHEVVVLEHAAAAAGAAVRHGLAGPTALLGGASPAYRVYACADGHIALAALEPHFWERTCSGLGVDGTHEAFERVFLTKTVGEWEALADRLDIPLVGVRAGTAAGGAAGDARGAAGAAVRQ